MRHNHDPRAHTGASDPPKSSLPDSPGTMPGELTEEPNAGPFRQLGWTRLVKADRPERTASAAVRSGSLETRSGSTDAPEAPDEPMDRRQLLRCGGNGF